MRLNAQNNLAAMLVSALALMIGALFSYYYFYQVGDDSYIYFRYVDKALAGQFGNWPGDGKTLVEGYSSPLWLGLLIAGQSLGFAAIGFSKVLGLLSVALLFAASFGLAKCLRLNPLASAVVLLLLSLHAGLHYWATSGLETPFYSALFVTAVWAMVAKKYYWLPLALIGLARPEGPFLLVALLLAMAWHYRGRINYALLFSTLIPTIIYLVWRYNTFAVWLPNTFYAKASSGSATQVANGLFYSLPVLFVFVGICVAYFKNPNPKAKIVLGATAMLLAVVVAGGGDWMFYLRLLQPIVPLLLLLLVFYFCQCKTAGKLLLILSLVPLLLFSVPLKDMGRALLLKQLPELSYQEGELTNASIQLAKKLKTQLPKASLIAVNHAGALPFAMEDYQFIDMVGLNDPHIAKAEGELHRKFDMAYVLAQKPDAIVLNTRVKPGSDGKYYHLGYWSGEDALVQMPGFKKHYQAMGLEAHWRWQLPFPYHYFAQYPNNWVVVYKRVD